MKKPVIEILFRDDFFVAVNKPALFPVHETADPLRPHVQGLVEAQLGEKLVLFHRLDLETTGVLLFGRNDEINRSVTEMFRDREMQKTYWTVVDGRWLEDWSLIRTYISKKGGGRWQNIPKGKGGDLAVSRFSVLKSSGEKSWLEVKPETGRTHQIRLHCLEKKHAVLGDKLYGRAHPRGIPMALHAKTLSFTHPITKKELTISATPPDYWKEFWLKGLQ